MKRRGAAIGVCASVLVLALGGFALRQHVFDAAALALKEGNYQQAASRLKPLAQLGDSQAQDLLGDLYAFGWGVPKDDGEAIKWYRRAGTGAAELKDRAAPAMYFVGKRYLEGTGVARDEVEARKWFERSAEGGYGKATEQLARLSH